MFLVSLRVLFLMILLLLMAGRFLLRVGLPVLFVVALHGFGWCV